MAKTAAERKKEQRERLKANENFKSFKEKESKKQKERRSKNKKTMTIEEKEALKVKKREEMRRYRAKKAQKAVKDEQSTSFNSNSDSPRKAFKSPASFGKALARVKKNLPRSPNKSKALVKKLACQLIPDIVQPTPKKQTVSQLSGETISKVKEFFLQDSISYQAPGTKDYVIMKDENGEKLKLQKKYLCMTLGEAYEIFQTENPDVKVCRSKFCELRPIQVCLRHETPSNLCLCIYHENIRLLLSSICVLPSKTSDLVSLIVCDDCSEECFYQNCDECGNLRKLHDITAMLSEADLEKEIKFFQWLSDETKTVSRQRISSSLKEAIEKLEKKLPQFLQHVYAKRQQELFFQDIKKNIPLNTLILHFDFSENYSFISQDEIQSAHWVLTSCTLYTAIAYFVHEEICQSIPIVVVSDYLHHDKYAVYKFNDTIIRKIQDDFPNLVISKVIYQSDGTGQHFKQKYSICLAMLQSCDVEWHFSATGHGKGPIDGIGGIVKRRIREATLSRKIDPRSAEDFFHAAKNICRNITVLHVTARTILEEKSQIDKLCAPSGKEILQIPETRKMHCFIKIKDYELKAANVSMKPKKFLKINLITGEVETLKSEVFLNDIIDTNNELNIGNWVLVPFAGKKNVKHFAGQIIGRDKSFAKVKFLKWKINHFIWPSKEDTSLIDTDEKDIVKLPEPDFDRRCNLTFTNFDFNKFLMG